MDASFAVNVVPGVGEIKRKPHDIVNQEIFSEANSLVGCVRL